MSSKAGSSPGFLTYCVAQAVLSARSRGVGDNSSLDLAERVSWLQNETLSLTIQKGIEIAPRKSPLSRYCTAIAESVGKLDDP